MEMKKWKPSRNGDSEAVHYLTLCFSSLETEGKTSSVLTQSVSRSRPEDILPFTFFLLCTQGLGQQGICLRAVVAQKLGVTPWKSKCKSQADRRNIVNQKFFGRKFSYPLFCSLLANAGEAGSSWQHYSCESSTNLFLGQFLSNKGLKPQTFTEEKLFFLYLFLFLSFFNYFSG